MNNRKEEPGQGFKDMPATGRSLFPEKPWSCHKYCLFLIIILALFPGRGEVCSSH